MPSLCQLDRRVPDHEPNTHEQTFCQANEGHLESKSGNEDVTTCWTFTSIWLRPQEPKKNNIFPVVMNSFQNQQGETNNTTNTNILKPLDLGRHFSSCLFVLQELADLDPSAFAKGHCPRVREKDKSWFATLWYLGSTGILLVLIAVWDPLGKLEKHLLVLI